MRTTNNATISLRALHAVNCAASNVATYYLAGVCVELTADGATYIATDGQVMIAHHAPLAKDDDRNLLVGTFILPAEFCAKIKHKLSDYGELERLDASSSDLILTSIDNGKLIVKPIDGTFPDWRRVVPTSVDLAVAHFNPAKLMQFERAALILTNERKGVKSRTRLSPNGPGPALVSFPSDDTFGVVMPFGVSKKGFEAVTTPPAWAKACAPAVEPETVDATQADRDEALDSVCGVGTAQDLHDTIERDRDMRASAPAQEPGTVSPFDCYKASAPAVAADLEF